MILSCLAKNQCVSGMEILCIPRRMWLQDYKYEIVGKTFDGIIQIYILSDGRDIPTSNAVGMFSDRLYYKEGYHLK